MRELSLNILDIAQNSIAAKASLIEISVIEEEGKMKIIISDNGCGMDKEIVHQVQNPFFTTRTTRKVGMGIPLFKMAAEMTGGNFTIESSPGKGTRIEAIFNTKSIDFIPLGDISETIILLITCNPHKDFVYAYSRNNYSFIFDTREIKEQLQDIPLSTPEVVSWIKKYIKGKMDSYKN